MSAALSALKSWTLLTFGVSCSTAMTALDSYILGAQIK